MKESVRKEIERIIEKLDHSYLIEEFGGNLCKALYDAVVYFDLSEDFMREFKDRINWFNVSVHQVLSEKFIKEFKNKVFWDQISLFQVLSESFLEKFRDKINWYSLSNNKKQVLSEKFIIRFQHRLDFNSMVELKKVSRERMEEIIELNKIHSRWELLDL